MKFCIALAVALVALLPVSAKAETQEDQMACMNDAFTLCSHAIPDRDRVGACLASNMKRLSPGCRQAFIRNPKPRSNVTPVRN